MKFQHIAISAACCLIIMLQYVECSELTNSITSPTRISEVKLEGGSEKCEGRLQIRAEFSGRIGQACNLNTSNNEAMVICRQLGCSARGAIRVNSTRYGFDPAKVNTYMAFGNECKGSENDINSCIRHGANCRLDTAQFAVAIRCGGVSAGATVTAGIVQLALTGLVGLIIQII